MKHLLSSFMKSKYFDFWQSSEKKKGTNSLFEISLWLMQTRFPYTRQMEVHRNWEIRPWRRLLNFPNFVADVWSLMFYSIVYMIIFNLMRLFSWYNRSITRTCSYPQISFSSEIKLDAQYDSDVSVKSVNKHQILLIIFFLTFNVGEFYSEWGTAPSYHENKKYRFVLELIAAAYTKDRKFRTLD